MVFDKVKEKLGGGGSEGEETEVVMPSDPKVVKAVSEDVDTSNDAVEEAVKEFQEVGAMVYPLVDKKAVRGDGKNVKDEGTPSFIYEVYENEEVLVVGGAKNIVLSLADRLELSNTETRAVSLAQNLAADMNGFSEHMVMDDVFMVPKEKRFASRFDGLEELSGEEGSNGGANKLEEKMEGIEEVEENGFVLETPERFGEALNLDEKRYFGVSYRSDRESIRLELDPKARDGEARHGVIRPNGNIHIPREIAVGLGVEYRDVDWGMENGKVVGEMKEGSVGKDVEDTMRTSLVEDNVNDMVRAHLSGSHTRTLKLEEGDEVGVYLEPDGDDFAVVVTPHFFEAPTDNVVEIENIGTGTEMLCFGVPDEIADVLGIDDGKERQVEWGIRGGELVGSIVRL